ncbi:hypothetical protein ACMSI6_10815 [Pseudomonas antarctica]|uniref:hypothetical protein n=1 Tax=Pseudomonas antarctica TaxID=219572 RepID=UPI0039C24C25
MQRMQLRAPAHDTKHLQPRKTRHLFDSTTQFRLQFAAKCNCPGHSAFADLGQTVHPVDGGVAQVTNHDINAPFPAYLRHRPLAVACLQNVVDAQMLERLHQHFALKRLII